MFWSRKGSQFEGCFIGEKGEDRSTHCGVLSARHRASAVPAPPQSHHLRCPAVHHRVLASRLRWVTGRCRMAACCVLQPCRAALPRAAVHAACCHRLPAVPASCRRARSAFCALRADCAARARPGQAVRRWPLPGPAKNLYVHRRGALGGAVSPGGTPPPVCGPAGPAGQATATTCWLYTTGAGHRTLEAMSRRNPQLWASEHPAREAHAHVAVPSGLEDLF